jgi:hypothetical protein
MPEPKKGATAGRTRITSIPGTRVYYKPALGKIVFRPTNVIRSSDKVIEINKRLIAAAKAGRAPASLCKNKPWKDFVKCLSEQMKAIVGK